MVDVFRLFAGLAGELKGTTVPWSNGVTCYTTRDPWGVVGAIIPWNAPLFLTACKLAPALVAGNTIVLKTAEQAPLAALRCAEILQQELPPGVVNVISGFGEEAGRPLRDGCPERVERDQPRRRVRLEGDDPVPGGPRTGRVGGMAEQRGDDLVAALAVAARAGHPDLTRDEQRHLQTLTHQAAIALEDRRLQQEVFAAVERIMPEIDVIQRQRGAVRYTDSPTQPAPEVTLTADPEFPDWVKDALSHYWGGPKLTGSPLLKMQIVEQTLPQHDDDAPKALRAVLAEAIEQLRPDGQRSLTAAEWILYNILEMRFIQGRRVREIALQLAMSESDLYRKQKIAVETVAAALSKMEERAGAKSPNGQHTEQRTPQA